MKNIPIMNKETLDDLIAKYYRGETSLEEEEILFAQCSDPASEGSPDSNQAQFLYFKTQRAQEPSTDFADRMERQWIDVPATKVLNVRLMLRIAAVVVAGLGLGWYFLSRENASMMHTVSTKTGEQTRIVLPDSTVVWLNEMTTLQYDPHFQQRQRNVWLHGEAYFEVHRDTLNPFIVHTREVSTTVVGTAFNVRAYETEQTIALDVAHGRVQFGIHKKVDVSQGQGARFDLKYNRIETMPSNPNASAWKTRQLVFDDVALRDVLRDLEHYFQVSFEAEDPALLRCHFKATFQNATLEEVLGVIGYSLHVHSTFQDGKYILSGQNCTEK
jgi:transmembrane sensor